MAFGRRLAAFLTSFQGLLGDFTPHGLAGEHVLQTAFRGGRGSDAGRQAGSRHLARPSRFPAAYSNGDHRDRSRGGIALVGSPSTFGSTKPADPRCSPWGLSLCFTPIAVGDGRPTGAGRRGNATGRRKAAINTDRRGRGDDRESVTLSSSQQSHGRARGLRGWSFRAVPGPQKLHGITHLKRGRMLDAQGSITAAPAKDIRAGLTVGVVATSTAAAAEGVGVTRARITDGRGAPVLHIASEEGRRRRLRGRRWRESRGRDEISNLADRAHFAKGGEARSRPDHQSHVDGTKPGDRVRGPKHRLVPAPTFLAGAPCTTS